MKNQLNSIFFLLFYLLCLGHAVCQEMTLAVTSYGEGLSQSDAINDALRNSIEKTYGSYFSIESEVQNDNLIKDEIISISQGNINEYALISETLLPNGSYSVLVTATLDAPKIYELITSNGNEVNYNGNLFYHNIKSEILYSENETSIFEDFLYRWRKTHFINYSIEAVLEPKPVSDATLLSEFFDSKEGTLIYHFDKISRGEEINWRKAPRQTIKLKDSRKHEIVFNHDVRIDRFNYYRDGILIDSDRHHWNGRFLEAYQWGGIIEYAFDYEYFIPIVIKLEVNQNYKFLVDELENLIKAISLTNEKYTELLDIGKKPFKVMVDGKYYFLRNKSQFVNFSQKINKLISDQMLTYKLESGGESLDFIQKYSGYSNINFKFYQQHLKNYNLNFNTSSALHEALYESIYMLPRKDGRSWEYLGDIGDADGDGDMCLPDSYLLINNILMEAKDNGSYFYGNEYGMHYFHIENVMSDERVKDYYVFEHLCFHLIAKLSDLENISNYKIYYKQLSTQ